jgi:hypothetical protein
MATENPRPPHWSGPVERLDAIEQRPLLDTMSARPRIEIDSSICCAGARAWHGRRRNPGRRSPPMLRRCPSMRSGKWCNERQRS